MMLNLRPLINTFCLSCLTLLPSCSDEEPAPRTSGNEIVLDVADWKPLATGRATVYDSETFTDHSKGGGEFSLNAYVGTTDNAYLNGARVWRREDGEWGFIAADGSAIKYYWPASEHLTFFAYMPCDLSADYYVNIGAYTAAGGQTFTCNMPPKIVFDGNQGMTKDGYMKDSELREFICAYTPDKFKEDVTMSFVHPFAAVDLIVAKAPVGLRLQSVTFNNIYLQGTCTVSSTAGTTGIGWMPNQSSVASCEIWIDRLVPNNDDLNLSVPIGGPYIVMPHGLNPMASLIVTYLKPGATDPTVSSIMIAPTVDNIKAWEPGKRYTYALNFGSDADDVSLKVTVEQWTEYNYENVVEVE